MPLRGNEHTAHVNDTNLYFTSLAELDDWADAPSEKRTGILAYKRRLASSDVTATVSKGTLLVSSLLSAWYVDHSTYAS